LNDAHECELDIGGNRIEFGAAFAQRGHNATRKRFTIKLSSRWQRKPAGTVKFWVVVQFPSEGQFGRIVS